MPSTYSTRLRLELQATGENISTWGDKANSIFSRLEDSIAAITSVNLGTSVSVSYTLSAVNGAYDQARNAILRLSGNLVSSVAVVLPAVEKNYWVHNNTSGSSLRIGPTGGSFLTILPGWNKIITDGSNCWAAAEQITYLLDASASTKYATLSASQSITGANTFTSAVVFQAPVSASTITVANKVNTSALAATIISATNLVAVSTLTANLFATNGYFTSVSASAIYVREVLISGSTALTSAALPPLLRSNLGTGTAILAPISANTVQAYTLELARTVVNNGATNNKVTDVDWTIALVGSNIKLTLTVTKNDDATGVGVGVGGL